MSTVPIPTRKPPIPSPSGGFGSLGAFDPGGTIVGFLDPAENMEESVGQTVGGIAGSFIPVPVVGTALGAFIGGKLGGLFGDDGDYPYVRADVRVEGASGKGAFVKDVTTLDGASPSDGRSLGQAVADTINDIIAFIGGEVRFERGGELKENSIFKLGYADARGALDTGFFAGGRGDFGSGATYEGLKSADVAIEKSLTEFLSKATFVDAPEAQTIINEGLKAGQSPVDILNDIAVLQTAQATPTPTDSASEGLGLVKTQNNDAYYMDMSKNQNNSLPLLLTAALGFILFN